MNPMLMFRIADHLSLNVNDPSDPLFSPSVQRFVDKWDAWLKEPKEGTSEPCDIACSQIQLPALRKFLEALSDLQPNESLLTTQVDVKCPEDLSSEYSCALVELIASLESLEMFKIVSEYLSNNDDARKVSELVGKSAFDADCCQSWQKSHPCEAFTRPELTTAHFVTALLMTWPSRQCSSTNGNELRKAAMAQLSRSSQVFQNEMALLHQQLDSMFAYMNKCRIGSCGCKNTVSAQAVN